MSLEMNENQELLTLTFDKLQIKSSKKLCSGHWLELEEVEYIEPTTKTLRAYEVCKRRTKFVKRLEVDGIKCT